MREQERSGTVSQKVAVKRLKQQVEREKRRDATEKVTRDAAAEFEERRKAAEAAKADDDVSGSSTGGRSTPTI